jgi:DUF971 family protein
MIPKDISSKDQALQILWSDGHQGVYPFRDLRLACPCANCVHEWTREKILDPHSIPEDIKPKDASYVGHYALSIDWSDGHNSGIYTFDALRQMCQCAECKNA